MKFETKGKGFYISIGKDGFLLEIGISFRGKVRWLHWALLWSSFEDVIE